MKAYRQHGKDSMAIQDKPSTYSARKVKLNSFDADILGSHDRMRCKIRKYLSIYQSGKNLSQSTLDFPLYLYSQQYTGNRTPLAHSQEQPTHPSGAKLTAPIDSPMLQRLGKALQGRQREIGNIHSSEGIHA